MQSIQSSSPRPRFSCTIYLWHVWWNCSQLRSCTRLLAYTNTVVSKCTDLSSHHAIYFYHGRAQHCSKACERARGNIHRLHCSGERDCVGIPGRLNLSHPGNDLIVCGNRGKFQDGCNNFIIWTARAKHEIKRWRICWHDHCDIGILRVALEHPVAWEPQEKRSHDLAVHKVPVPRPLEWSVLSATRPQEGRQKTSVLYSRTGSRRASYIDPR